MILVTGAAGKTGQAIIRALANRGAAVRALVYRAEQVETVTQLRARETIVGDMHAGAIFRQAAQGVRAIYHISPNMNPAEVELGRIAIEAAQAGGVEHFVYHSVLHPQTEAMPHHWHKLRVEELLFESGLDTTILQPAAYMQNILGGWQSIVEQGVYRVPYPVETRLGMVDLEDVAEAAAIVLLEPGHDGAIYELAGPDVLTQTDVARILTVRLGRPVRAEQIAMDAWLENARAAGLGDYQVETLIKMFQYYERYGLWGNANVLRWLLGRAPTRFEVFMERVK
jgi:NAD(P)H dehydrogenase (quinone)